MYSCKKASRIASDALDRKLTWYESLNLRLHLSMCAMCRRFNQNIHIMEATLKIMRDSPAGLTAGEKEAMHQHIKAILEKEK